jgi:hypothetical protein
MFHRLDKFYTPIQYHFFEMGVDKLSVEWWKMFVNDREPLWGMNKWGGGGGGTADAE